MFSQSVVNYSEKSHPSPEAHVDIFWAVASFHICFFFFFWGSNCKIDIFNHVNNKELVT